MVMSKVTPKTGLDVRWFESSSSINAIMQIFKLYNMKVEDLIKELLKLPQDLPVRTENEYPNGENEWIEGLEYSETGQSGYEIEGEVRLLTTLDKTI
jgi:hypothetical protein